MHLGTESISIPRHLVHKTNDEACLAQFPACDAGDCIHLLGYEQYSCGKFTYYTALGQALGLVLVWLFEENAYIRI